MSPFPKTLSRHAAVAALFAGTFAALPAHALYKVVGPDGKVTYTDRPPVTQENKVQPVNATTGGTSVSTGGLPYELQQVVQRYPVTLYSASGCGPCDSARQALRQRGVPFTERTIVSAEDQDALQRRTGKPDLPAVTIGSQVMSGFDSRGLTGYLDAAGYPKRSVLPQGYAEAPARPLTTPTSVQSDAPAPSPAAAPSPAPTPAPAADPSGIKF